MHHDTQVAPGGCNRRPFRPRSVHRAQIRSSARPHHRANSSQPGIRRPVAQLHIRMRSSSISPAGVGIRAIGNSVRAPISGRPAIHIDRSDNAGYVSNPFPAGARYAWVRQIRRCGPPWARGSVSVCLPGRAQIFRPGREKCRLDGRPNLSAMATERLNLSAGPGSKSSGWTDSTPKSVGWDRRRNCPAGPATANPRADAPIAIHNRTATGGLRRPAIQIRRRATITPGRYVDQAVAIGEQADLIVIESDQLPRTNHPENQIAQFMKPATDLIRAHRPFGPDPSRARNPAGPRQRRRPLAR